jgi:hypothetical protein
VAGLESGSAAALFFFEEWGKVDIRKRSNGYVTSLSGLHA